jgi:hypothetical protein
MRTEVCARTQPTGGSACAAAVMLLARAKKMMRVGKDCGARGGTPCPLPSPPSLARALCGQLASNAPTSSPVRLPCAQCRGDGGVLMPPGPVGPCGALPGVVPSDWGPHSSPRNLFLNSTLFLTHPRARASARPRPALLVPWTTPKTREIRARARATPAPRQTGSSRNFVSFLLCSTATATFPTPTRPSCVSPCFLRCVGDSGSRTWRG